MAAQKEVVQKSKDNPAADGDDGEPPPPGGKRRRISTESSSDDEYAMLQEDAPVEEVEDEPDIYLKLSADQSKAKSKDLLKWWKKKVRSHVKKNKNTYTPNCLFNFIRDLTLT